MTIRQYAKQNEHTIIGKLTRHPEFESDINDLGEVKHSDFKFYMDEAGNEYHVCSHSVCIVNLDGAVI